MNKKKLYGAILFDLDGTLLPMDNDEFTMTYLGLLSKAVAHLGYDPKTMIPAMWKSVAAMVKNNGERKNSDVFWENFSAILGRDASADIAYFDAFYTNEFHRAKEVTRPTPLAKRVVSLAREMADKVVLATSPIFPEVAVRSRLEWAGLSYDDFDLVTSYENSCYCKPNPLYYTDILKRIDVCPETCLMIGNNSEEDADASRAAGIECYLITDYLIGTVPEWCPHGTFEELLARLKARQEQPDL